MHLCRFLGIFILLCAIVAGAMGTSPASGAAVAVQSFTIANPNFDQGDAAPAGWTLSGGQGRWLDRHILEVTGNGTDNNVWRSEYRFAPGSLYRFQVHARRVGGSGGCTVTGPEFANRDQSLSRAWKWYGHVFRAPDNAGSNSVRLGQWCAAGTSQFDAVRLRPVLPVHRAIGHLRLGEGESIPGGRYTFTGDFSHEGSNFHRTLLSATAAFNSCRWCFGGHDQITYCFHLPGHAFGGGTVAFNVGYCVHGGCLAEISRDQIAWRRLVTREGVGLAEAKLPADMLPAETLYLRLRPSVENSSFQVDRIEFSADVAGTPPDALGRTAYAEIGATGGDLVVEDVSYDDGENPCRPIIRLTARNRGAAALQAALVAQGDGRPADAGAQKEKSSPGQIPQAVDLAPGQRHTFTAAVPLVGCGKHDIRLSLRAGGVAAMTATLPWTVSEYYRADFGRRIESAGGGVDVWWCESPWKIHPRRPSPQATSVGASLAAARNDREAVQIVLRPTRDLKRLTAAVGALHGPGGATIAADHVQVLRVYYHRVHTPTDESSVQGEWPDALPPLRTPLDLPAGKNQPLWLLVHVPKDAPAGDYAGALMLKAEGWSAAVPLRVHVWNFALPERNHVETAFGLSPDTIYRYHRVKSEADKRRVLDMYLQNFADHRISPYNPTPFDPIRVKFAPEANPPRAEVDFSAFDAAMSRAIEKFHFTNFVLPVEGMGGGTFEGRDEPRIGAFGEKTPQYRAMFSSCVQQLESHLRAKGWLKMAYTYWFDEPDPKDYAFVQAGMDRLKKYAPGIQTMITKHELQPDWSGRMDIWCPLSPNYDPAVAEKRRARGERYWWYVCCGPKTPYCTLFIDHPATELRTWLWQTWQRNIVGILVWETDYWTSRGDLAQNPYEDPMGYVAGSRPNERKYWGNGDGRFLYPPLAAAAPGTSGEPIIEPPVSSIRWEMLREGIEDYEYLWLLRDLIGRRRTSLAAADVARYESLLKVPEVVTRDMTRFTTDPRPIYVRRAAIAAAIEQLAK
jgi:hypothetical protein